LGAVFLRIVVTLAVVTLGSEVRAGSAEPFPADRAARRRAQLEDLEQGGVTGKIVLVGKG